MSAIASESQAKRSFEKVFPAALLPPHYFETVIYGGTVRWGVLLGLEFCIVPIGASDDKKILRLKFSDVTKAAIYREEHFSFADAESTERSAKVLLTVEVAPDTPTGRMFGSSSRNRSTSQGSQHGKMSREETFFVFEANSKLYDYMQQMWRCMLTTHLYAWHRHSAEESSMSEGKIKRLFAELVDEIHKSETLQDRVDLIDELALAARFNINLKKLILLSQPSLLNYLVSELRKMSTDKWRSLPEFAQLGRAEVLQFALVLLEGVHKTLFMSWPLFVNPQARSQLALLLEPKGGSVQVLVSAVMASLVTPEEVKQSPLKHTATDVVHMSVAVLYQVAKLLEQLQLMEPTSSSSSDFSSLYLHSYVLAALPVGAALERRVEVIFSALQVMLLEMPASTLRIVTVYHYAYFLHVIFKNPSALREVIAKNHGEDMRLVLSRFILPPEESTHPLQLRTSICFLKILAAISPQQAKLLMHPALDVPLD